MNRKELEMTASLAMLELHDEEIASLSSAVTSMLDYFSLMEEVDVDGLEPTTHAFTMQQSVRVDQRHDDDNEEGIGHDLLENGPEHDGQYFIIPHVL